MKAMLLAAGEGRRLRSLTDRIPKPMLRIAGRPILEYNIRLLAYYGFREIIINLYHCPEVVTDYFGDGSRWGVSIRYSLEEKLLGTAGAVKRVQAFFDQTFLVMYGDNLTNCNLNALLARHRATSAMATVALFYRQDVSASGVAVLSEEDRIRRFIEKPQMNSVSSHWVNAGLLVLEPQVLQFIPEDHPVDFGYDVLPALIAEGLPVFGYRMTEKLWWIDTPEAYEQVRLLGEKGGLELP